jgi:hypothetical protein
MEKSIEEQAYEKFISDYNKYGKLQSCPKYLNDIMRAAMGWKTKNIKISMGSTDGGSQWRAYPILHVCKTLIYSGEFDIMEIMNGEIETPQISESNLPGEQPGFESDKPF